MKDLQIIIQNKIGIDNILHFLAGGWAACLAPTWYYALLIGFSIGLLKELSDRFIRKTKFNAIEWLATFLGSGVTAGVMLINRYKHDIIYSVFS